MTPHGKKSMLKLAQRMSDYFWSGICPSTACKWDVLPISDMGNSDMKIMYRKHPDANSSIVLSAATSVWMPLPRQRVFDFLREAQMRGEWDALSNGGAMQEVVHIAKGQALGNSISILSANNVSALFQYYVLHKSAIWNSLCLFIIVIDSNVILSKMSRHLGHTCQGLYTLFPQYLIRCSTYMLVSNGFNRYETKSFYVGPICGLETIIQTCT